MYSCVDERSAAYFACGLAAESGEPVALSCTGATASRNYFSALTEAFYRKLPILAITSTQDESKIGHLIPQVLDRSQQPLDIVKESVHLQNVKDPDDEWDVCVKANRAILALNHHGMGPVHINLSTRYSSNFMIKELPVARKISRVSLFNELPEIHQKKVAVYVGSHVRWTKRLTDAVDRFCETYNALVFTEPCSNYTGKYGVAYAIASCQDYPHTCKNPDLLIHIGEMSDMCGIVGKPKEVWRVSDDGKLVDRYRTLSNVFEMPEEYFFERYADERPNADMSYYRTAIKECEFLLNNIPDLPLSQIWIASQMHDKFPANSTIHLGILSPLRSWSYFPIDKEIEIYCNQGGFGIDGNMSTMIGASMVHPEKIFYAMVGDLSFFYDMNVLGNRHVGRNVRILLVNNSVGVEFHLFKQLNCTSVNGVERYISAGGHNGRQSIDLVKHFATDLGFEYIQASSKDEFLQKYERFVTPEMTDKPMVFEVFTKIDDENLALKNMWSIKKDESLKAGLKQLVRDTVGKNNMGKMKRLLGR
jgi:2-succinyl-5-enolpyruvyl-6-hydroxy-3-cyclohexene-1-carboxylate synthase